MTDIPGVPLVPMAPLPDAQPCGDVELAALLCTRLCHDLAGPVGAVSAGAELIADETDPAFLAESIHLLRHSSDAASARLRFLRVAFGLTGRGGGVGMARGLLAGYIDAVHGAAVTMTWREEPADALADPNATRLVLNLALCGLDSLAGGGSLALSITRDGARLTARAFATGSRAALDMEAAAALAGDGRAVGPRSVQAYLLHRLAAGHGGLRMATGTGYVCLEADFVTLSE